MEAIRIQQVVATDNEPYLVSQVPGTLLPRKSNNVRLDAHCVASVLFEAL